MVRINPVRISSKKGSCRTVQDTNDGQWSSSQVMPGRIAWPADTHPHASKSSSAVFGAEISEKGPKTTSSTTSVTSAVLDFLRVIRASRGSATRLARHSLKSIKRSKETGKVMSFAPVDKLDLNRLLRETLVPLEGFACRAPADPRRASTIKAMTARLNESLQTRGFVDDGLQVPPEALCRVVLHTVGMFDGDANMLADRTNFVRLGVRVHGILLFPADDHCYDRTPDTDCVSASAMKNAVKARTQKGRKQDGRFQLVFELHIALERSAQDAHLEDADVPALQVKVVAIDVPKTQDAVTDSWLPKEDLLSDIEDLIDDKLQEALAEAAEAKTKLRRSTCSPLHVDR